MKSLTILKDRIIARLVTAEVSAGGIHLPESAQQTAPSREADVLYVGPDVKDVKPHDRVFLDFGGGWVKLEDELLISCREENVIAVKDK